MEQRKEDRRMGKRTLSLLLAAVILAAAVLWYLNKDRELSEPPPYSTSMAAPNIQISPSTIAIKVALPFAQLSAQADKSAPENYSVSGNEPGQCIREGVRFCVSTKYEFDVSRGAISIGPGPKNSIHLSVPIDISGRGWLQGPLSGLLRLGAARFHTKLEAFADIHFSLKPDWCPAPTVNADFRWIEPAEVEIFQGLKIDIDGLIQKKLREQVHKMGDDLAAMIKCEDIRHQIQRAWNVRTFPVRLPNDDKPLYVNIEPISFGFSGVECDSKSASLVLMLTPKIDVAAKPLEVKPLVLPNVQTVPFAESSLNLAVPFHMSYADLADNISVELIGKPITTDTQAGVVTVKVRKIKVYPSNDRLAIAGLLNIGFPSSWFDINGWIYLTGTPVPINEGTGLKLEGLELSRAIDNDLWNAASVVFNGTLKSEMERIGTIDLKSRIQQAKDAIAAEFAKPLDGAVIDIGAPDIRLGSIVLASDQLSAEGIFSSKADIIFQALK